MIKFFIYVFLIFLSYMSCGGWEGAIDLEDKIYYYSLIF